jgi:hypothetical protein
MLETAMNPRSFVLFFCLALFGGCPTAHKSEISASPHPETPEQSPDPTKPGPGWKRVDADGLFFLSLPKGMKKQNVQGIDSSVGQYSNGRMVVSFDYGIYSNRLESYSDKPGYKENLKDIGGKKAKIVFFSNTGAGSKYKYYSAVHFPEVGKSVSVNMNSRLTLDVEFNEESDIAIAQAIFESIACRN